MSARAYIVITSADGRYVCTDIRRGALLVRLVETAALAYTCPDEATAEAVRPQFAAVLGEPLTVSRLVVPSLLDPAEDEPEPLPEPLPEFAPQLFKALVGVIEYADSRAEDLEAARAQGNEDPTHPGAIEARDAVEFAREVIKSVTQTARTVAKVKAADLEQLGELYEEIVGYNPLKKGPDDEAAMRKCLLEILALDQVQP